MAVFWDELAYEVVKYPMGKVTLIIHTLSLEDGFIDV